jgi:hypothetical protein
MPRKQRKGQQKGVLVQPEMEKRRSPLVSIPPFGRGFSRHGVFRSDGGWAAQERALTPPFIVSMSPPGYPSAWLRPRSARFRFARQNRCNSATSCRFSTSGLPVTPPEPQTGQTRIVSCDRLVSTTIYAIWGLPINELYTSGPCRPLIRYPSEANLSVIFRSKVE